MAEPEKITIIEGPPPTFELVSDGSLISLTEGPAAYQVALCRLRTFNGPALVERCYRAWRQKQSISLEYRSEDNSTQEAPIVAVRSEDQSDGQVLLVWVRLPDTDIEIELDLNVDDDEDDDWPIGPTDAWS